MCRDGMGRAGYVPSWLCAEFAMCRADPAPSIYIGYLLLICIPRTPFLMGPTVFLS